MALLATSPTNAKTKLETGHLYCSSVSTTTSVMTVVSLERVHQQLRSINAHTAQSPARSIRANARRLENASVEAQPSELRPRLTRGQRLPDRTGTICSRKDRSAIVWDTAASRWDLDSQEAPRLRSHPMRVRCRPVGLESKADWKVCRCWADAARSDSGLASPSSRGTSQRETVSDTVASLCNPAVPEAPQRHSGARPR
jgi:hypothetical protein